jgi:phenylacetate-CoA ligase
VVPVGTGQSRRLLELIPRLGITAIFGTLSYPAYLAARARELGVEPRSLGIRRIVTAGEPGAGLATVRSEIEEAWGAAVVDSFGMSDVWSTMGGACEEGDGVHLTVDEYAVLEVVDPESGDPLPLADGASGEFVWTHLRREASPLLRYRSADLGRLWTSRCACGRTTPRIRIDGRRDDMLRVQAVNVYPQAIGTVLGSDPALGRYCVVADGDPIVPPLRIYVEAPDDVELGDVTAELEDKLRARFAVTRLEPGSLPVAEHKTRIVHRTARGDRLPEAVEALRREIAR